MPPFRPGPVPAPMAAPSVPPVGQQPVLQGQQPGQQGQQQSAANAAAAVTAMVAPGGVVAPGNGILPYGVPPPPQAPQAGGGVAYGCYPQMPPQAGVPAYPPTGGGW